MKHFFVMPSCLMGNQSEKDNKLFFEVIELL